MALPQAPTLPVRQPQWLLPAPELSACFPTSRPLLTVSSALKALLPSPLHSAWRLICISERLSLNGTPSVPRRPKGSWLYPPHSSETSPLMMRGQHLQPPGLLVSHLSPSSTRCVTLSRHFTSQASVSSSVKWVTPPSQDRCKDQRADIWGKHFASCKKLGTCLGEFSFEQLPDLSWV